MHLISIITLFVLALGAFRSPVVPPVAGEEIAGYGPISQGSGWVLTRDKLYLTQDEGLTWQDVTPARDAGVLLAADFVSDGHGWLLMGRPGADEQSLLTLARTSDFGSHWQSAPLSLFVVDDPDPTIGAVRLDFSSASEGVLHVRHVSSSNFERWSEWRTFDGGLSWVRTRTAEDAKDGAVRAARDSSASSAVFAGKDDGWKVERTGQCTQNGATRTCEQVTGLHATSDGGRTWRDVKLPDGVGGLRQWTVGEISPAGAAIAGGSRTLVAHGQGFDKCEVPTLDEFRDWRSASPYSAVNLYVGGTNRSCKNLALSSSYLQAVYDIGWTFVPTWVGPQSPCISHPEYYDALVSLDPTTAWNQGWSEANVASDRLMQLGLTEDDGSGSIVYYDIEHFGTGDRLCNAAVLSFVSGWTQGLQARGNMSGVYSTGSVLTLLANALPPPDAVWVANWTDSSYNPGATVWNAGLSNSLWVNNQRLRQYAANRATDPPETWAETWGNTTMRIDSDVLDGPVALMAPAPDTPTPSVTPMSTPTSTPTATPTSTRTRVPFTPQAWLYLPVLVQQ